MDDAKSEVTFLISFTQSYVSRAEPRATVVHEGRRSSSIRETETQQLLFQTRQVKVLGDISVYIEPALIGHRRRRGSSEAEATPTKGAGAGGPAAASASCNETAFRVIVTFTGAK